MADWSGNVELIERDGRRRISSVDVDSKPTVTLDFSMDGSLLFAGGYLRAGIWSVPSLQPIRTWDNLNATAACFSPNGRWFVLAKSEGDVTAFESRESVSSSIHWFELEQLLNVNLPSQPAGSTELEGTITAIVFAQDGRMLLASSNANNAIRRWSFPDMDSLPSIDAPEQFIESFCLHPSGRV